jgi:hypothetical protein
VTETSNVGASGHLHQSASSQDSSGGLAQSTIIAIGVYVYPFILGSLGLTHLSCIPVVVIAVAIVGFLVWRRRRASHRGLPPSTPTPETDEMYSPPRAAGGRGILPPLDTRPVSDVYGSYKGSYKSSTDDVPDKGIPTRLPPLTDQDEDAKVAPLVPPRSPLRTLSRQGTRPESMGESAFVEMGIASEESHQGVGVRRVGT